MTNLIIFDLDGTIIPNPSSEKLFLLWLARHGYLKIPQLWHALCFTLKWLPHFKQEIFVKNKAYLYDLPVDQITALAKDFTRQHLLPKIRPILEQKIIMHRNQGDTIILLTGTLQPIAQVFAAHLGFAEYYPTLCVYRDNRFTDLPPTQQPYREEKLTITQRICTKHQTSINDLVTYANSIHDVHLLEAAGKPIAVTPDKKLRRIAIKKGWEIIECEKKF